MLLLAFRQSDFDLGTPVFPVQGKRHQGVTLAVDSANQLTDFLAMEEELSYSARLGVYMGRGSGKGGNLEIGDKGLASFYKDVGVTQLYPACAQAFDFPALERHSGLEAVFDKIVVAGFLVECDGAAVMGFLLGHQLIIPERFAHKICGFELTVEPLRVFAENALTITAKGECLMSQRESIHGQWSSRWIFILAATGSAVGLGNIWKFPYITGENGGGAFVLVYLLCIAAVGIPIMIAEVMLGRRGRQSPINTMRQLAIDDGRSANWSLLGWSGVIAGLIILSFYSVIAGWALAYVLNAASGAFSGAPAEEIKGMFGALVSSPGELIFWHTLFMIMTMVVVARGVKRGLEAAIRWLMPALFVLLLIMVGYAMNSGEFGRGVSFLFSPDFSKISAEGILVAMGHAFFTLSLGMGAIMIYGSYMPKNASISHAVITIAVADTVVALLAGLAIFPIVFANNLEPGAGPGLIFQTLPIAFGQMPGGTFFGTLFFILLVFAAWTSAISIIEPAMSWLVESKGWSRVKASIWCGVATWVVGLGTVFSFNIWSDVTLWGKTFFDLADFLTANIMLPLGGLLIAIFAAWVMKKSASVDELDMGESGGYQLWRFLARYVTPIAVVIVFLKAVGAF